MKRRVVLAVLVCFAAVLGAFVAPASAAVAAPTGVQAVPRSGSSIEVSWARSPGFATYKVYRATAAGGPYTLIGTTPALRWTSNSLESGTHYFYTVRAVVSNVTSPPSAAVDARTFTPTTATTAYLNAKHDNSQPDESLPDQPRQLWSKDLGAQVSYPLVAEGLVVVAVANTDTYGTKLWAFRAGDGTTAWGPVSLGGGSWEVGLAYGSGAFYAVNFDGLLRRINASTGAAEWQKQVPDALDFRTQPVVVDDTLYLTGAGGPGFVYAIDVSTGVVRWKHRFIGTVEGSPVVSDGAVFVTDWCGQADRLDANTGETMWTRRGSCTDGYGSTSTVHDRKLYAWAGRQPAVLDIATGAEVVGPIATRHPPAFLGDQMLDAVGTMLTAYSTVDNRIQWFYLNPAEISVPPVVVGDAAVIAGVDGYVSVYRPNSQAFWRASAGSRIGPGDHSMLTGIAVAHGLIVVPATNRLTVFG